MELVPGRDSPLHRHVQVVNGPLPQVLHPPFSVRTRIVVDEGTQFSPLVEQVLPMRQLLLLGDHQEGAVDLVFELEAAEEVYERHPLPQAFLVC